MHLASNIDKPKIWFVANTNTNKLNEFFFCCCFVNLFLSRQFRYNVRDSYFLFIHLTLVQLFSILRMHCSFIFYISLSIIFFYQIEKWWEILSIMFLSSSFVFAFSLSFSRFECMKRIWFFFVFGFFSKKIFSVSNWYSIGVGNFFLFYFCCLLYHFFHYVCLRSWSSSWFRCIQIKQNLVFCNRIFPELIDNFLSQLT